MAWPSRSGTIRYNTQRSKDRAARRSGRISARQQRIARKAARRLK